MMLRGIFYFSFVPFYFAIKNIDNQGIQMTFAGPLPHLYFKLLAETCYSFFVYYCICY